MTGYGTLVEVAHLTVARGAADLMRLTAIALGFVVELRPVDGNTLVVIEQTRERLDRTVA